MDPKTLVTLYPWMDHLMAESLIKAHEAGTLQSLAETWDVSSEKTSTVVPDAITVEKNDSIE
jgi:hypothetical protein